MKYLHEYMEDAQTQLFKRMGSFFAFSNSQFDEAKKEGVTYTDMGAGLICPKENALELSKGLEDISKKGIAQDIAENGKEAIIKRELYNHECFYTMDYSDCVDKLEDYDFSIDDIKKVYNAEFTTACGYM